MVDTVTYRDTTHAVANIGISLIHTVCSRILRGDAAVTNATPRVTCKTCKGRLARTA